MWQATLGSGGKSYSLDGSKSYSSPSGPSSLSGFYPSGYPPTPPKESQTPEDQTSGGPSRGGAPGGAGGAGDDYINSSISSSISSEDLMSSDMKPTPESLMGFTSFPYSTRKI